MKTGNFSNSWSEEDHQKYLKDVEFLDQGKERPEFKLIEYTCLTDPDFEFVRHMKLR